MKANFIKAVIAICISGLISYGFYSFHDSDNKLLLSIGSFVFLAITLLFAIGISFDNLPRTTTMVQVVSIIFFIVALISNIAFSFFNFTPPIYIITNGIALLIYALVAYSVSRARQ
jgi:hypothetical protein